MDSFHNDLDVPVYRHFACKPHQNYISLQYEFCAKFGQIQHLTPEGAWSSKKRKIAK